CRPGLAASVAPALVPRDAACAVRLGDTSGGRAVVLADSLPSRLPCRPGAVRAARLLRARRRHDESLRPALQLVLFQRWLPCRAPRKPGPSLAPLARAPRTGRPRQPLARRAPLDGNALA